MRECGDASVCVLSEALDVGEEPERSVAFVEEYARFGRVAAIGWVHLANISLRTEKHRSYFGYRRFKLRFQNRR